MVSSCNAFGVEHDSTHSADEDRLFAPDRRTRQYQEQVVRYLLRQQMLAMEEAAELDKEALVAVGTGFAVVGDFVEDSRVRRELGVSQNTFAFAWRDKGASSVANLPRVVDSSPPQLGDGIDQELAQDHNRYIADRLHDGDVAPYWE